MGGVIDGCPAGLQLDFDFIRHELDRRKPVFPGSTTRHEPDKIEWLSGHLDGVTLGTPIGFLIRNKQSDPFDYEALKDVYRPSHADYAWEARFGIRDHRGGGRASGRETVSRVVAGAVARLLLRQQGVAIRAAVTRIGALSHSYPITPEDADLATGSPISWPAPGTERDVISLIQNLKNEHDTVGGDISCLITGVPPGWGDPVFHKLQSSLAAAMLSIGSAKGFEYGLGFQSPSLTGSVYNDPFTSREGRTGLLTNHDGGIQGGISNGADIYFRVAFKPVPSHGKLQETVDKDGNRARVKITGRHDVCHVPRIVVVVEAMAALVLADHYLLSLGARNHPAR